MGKIDFLNVGCGDATMITSGISTFLVDCHNIQDYSSLLPKNKAIRGVFITHQHEDHYSGLRFLKEQKYSIEFLIYSPYDRRRADNSVSIEEWNEFNSLKQHFIDNGTKPYAPYRQNEFNGKSWWEIDGIKFEIIGPDKETAEAETREIHDASLVVKAILNQRYCLFAGDASDKLLDKIAATTTNYCNDILHASHHGSINGASLSFIQKANIKNTMISTASGVHDNVPHPTALRRYKENSSDGIFRTDTDGSCNCTF